MPKKERYNIKMRNGEAHSVEGIIVNNIYGIDKRITTTVKKNKDNSERVLSSSRYYLTHIPSGVLISGARTQKALKELANRQNMIDQHDFKVMGKEVGDFWNSRGWQG